MIKIDLPSYTHLDKDMLYNDIKQHFEGTYDVSSYGWGKKDKNASVMKNKWVGAVVQYKSKKNQIWVSGMFPKAKQTMFVTLFIGWLLPMLFLRKKWNKFESEIAESVSQKYHGTYYRYPLWKEFLPVFVLLLSLFIAYIVVSEYYPNPQSSIPIYDESTLSYPLPTEFRKPAPDGPPHIVGAEIERISIPDCGGCYADIIKKMDDVSDDVIIKVNDSMTNSVFANSVFDIVDIRDSKNRNLSKDVEYIDNLGNRILYIDNDIISTYSNLEAYFKDTAHPARDPGSYYLIETRNTKDPTYTVFDRTDGVYTDQKVLEHFYPNGVELFDQYKKENNISDPEYPEDVCYGTYHKFPSSFYPTVRPNTLEVVFSVSFPYATIGPCSPGLEIAIPIADILREVPQYVPKDSVLWRFKE